MSQKRSSEAGSSRADLLLTGVRALYLSFVLGENI